MSRYFTPGQEPRQYVSPTFNDLDHPAWVGRRLAEAGIQVGNWSHVSPANGEEASGSFGPIEGPQVQLQFNSGGLWMESSTKAANTLQSFMIRDSAMKLLAPSRRQLETNLRINAQGFFRPWIESHIVGDGENRLYTHGTAEESDGVFRKARRRIEDSLRKELPFLFAALRGEYWAFPKPVEWYEYTTPPPRLVECREPAVPAPEGLRASIELLAKEIQKKFPGNIQRYNRCAVETCPNFCLGGNCCDKHPEVSHCGRSEYFEVIEIRGMT